MYKVMKTFICRGCVILVTGTRCPSVDIGVNANLEFVDKFCYLGDVLSVDGPFSALMLLVGWQEGHPACKKLSGGMLARLSGMRSRRAYSPAGAIATHYLLLQ